MSTINCAVVIQAGHQNTPDAKTGGSSKWGNELLWNPIVADEAVRVLRVAGIDAVKADASIKSTGLHFNCELALFLHFDAPLSGESGPSVGYPEAQTSDIASEWKQLYSRFWPYPETWKEDNFTKNLLYYYGYRYVEARRGQLLIEFGDLTSERQALWMEPRLLWLGRLAAYFAGLRAGVGGVVCPDSITPFEERSS